MAFPFSSISISLSENPYSLNTSRVCSPTCGLGRTRSHDTAGVRDSYDESAKEEEKGKRGRTRGAGAGSGPSSWPGMRRFLAERHEKIRKRSENERKR